MSSQKLKNQICFISLPAAIARFPLRYRPIILQMMLTGASRLQIPLWAADVRVTYHHTRLLLRLRQPIVTAPLRTQSFVIDTFK